jgi:hypothetical protein
MLNVLKKGYQIIDDQLELNNLSIKKLEDATKRETRLKIKRDKYIASVRKYYFTKDDNTDPAISTRSPERTSKTPGDMTFGTGTKEDV